MPSISPGLKSIFYRVLLPAALLAGCLIRPSLISLVYGILALASPFILRITSTDKPGSTNAFFLICLAFSGLSLLAQISFQIAASVGGLSASHIYYNCTNRETLGSILFQVGLQTVNSSDVPQSVRILLPECLVFAVSLLTYVVCSVFETAGDQTLTEALTGLSGTERFDSIPQEQSEPNVANIERTRAAETSESLSWKDKACVFLKKSSDVLSVILLCAAATLYPSALNFAYFLFFLLIVTWWALHASLHRNKFNGIKVLILMYAALHLIIIYVYQLPSILGVIPPDSIFSRLIGLSAVVKVECSTGDIGVWSLKWLDNFGEYPWQRLVNPIVILVFYFFQAHQLRITKDGTSAIRGDDRPTAVRDDASSVHEELLADDRDGSGREFGRQQSFVEAAKQDGGGFMGYFYAIIAIAVQQCYALSLITMIMWAVVYHSGFAFIWLILSCILWSLPNTKGIVYKLSPIIVFYAEILMIIQYVFSLDFEASEVPFSADVPLNSIMQDIGFYRVKNVATCVPLWLKIAFSLPFFVTLRIHRRDKSVGLNAANQPNYGTMAKRNGTPAGVVESAQSIQMARSWLTGLFGKYFIIVVCIVLLAVSIRRPLAIYSLGYLFAFLLFVTVIQVSFELFRRTVFGLYSLILLYSGAILIWIYIFQFKSVCHSFLDATGLNSSTARPYLHDLGLPDDCVTDTPWDSLLALLIAPLSVLLVVALQCKFFHRLWMSYTQYPDASESSRPKEEKSGWCARVLSWVNWVEDFIWQFAEIHMWKLVALSFALLCAHEVNAVNFVVMAILCLLIPGRLAHAFLCLLASLWLSTVLFVKVAIQLESVKRVDFDDRFDCTEVSHWNDTSIAKWTGFEKIGDSDQIGWYVRGTIMVLVLLAVQAVVRWRQAYWRKAHGRETPARPLLFNEIKRQNADDSITDACKYLANYAFYKFGVEICFVATMILAARRLDAVALVYVLWILILFVVPRTAQRRLWYIYAPFLLVVLAIQYAICVRIPCIQYPWDSSSVFPSSLVVWLYFPSNQVLQNNSFFLIGDAIQLILVCCQLRVFYVESSGSAEEFEGGSNAEEWRGGPVIGQVNNQHDFMTEAKSNLDVLKSGFFPFFQWVTLIMIFVAGLGAVSLFALGYLLAAFLFLWKGNDLYVVKPIDLVIKLWRGFAVYNIIVILCKVALQIVGCVYIDDLHQCWLKQLLSIFCLHNDIGKPETEIRTPESCSVRRNEADMTYDVLCFVFILIQLRILGSWYFRHVIAEFKAERILSSRGAVLINQLLKKEMKYQTKREIQQFAAIESKAEDIRRKYEALLLENNDAEMFDPENYAQAKRAGDYYMFNCDPNHPNEYILDQAPDSIAPEVEPGAGDQKGPDPLDMVHAAITEDMDFEAAQKLAEKNSQQKHKDGTHKSQASNVADFVPPPLADDSDEEDEAPKKKLVPKLDEEGEVIEGEFEEVNDDQEPSGGILGKIKGGLSFVWKFIESFLDWMTAFFNRRSRDHRYVAYVLNEEKRNIKEKAKQEEAFSWDANNKTVNQLREDLCEIERFQCGQTEQEIQKTEEEVQDYWNRNNAFIRFLKAAGYLMISNTELICYIVVFLNTANSAAILSLPLPFLVLFWGTLCTPRPPKFFWIVLIAYTEGLVVVKFLFQFQFFKFNDSKDVSPFFPPRIIGIERSEGFAIWDVALLICLFFHRYMMRKLGLWKDARAIVAKSFLEDEEEGQSGELRETSDGSVEMRNLSALQNNSKTTTGVGNENGGPSSAPDRWKNTSPRPRTDRSLPPKPPSKMKHLSSQTKGFGLVFAAGASDPDSQAVVVADDGEQKGSSAASYFGGCGSFYHDLFNPKYKYIRDLYPFMFLADLCCLLICAFGYSEFGLSAGSGDVLSDVQSNRVPLPWVLMLITLVILIILDRGLYLRQSVHFKLIFQYLLVIGVHVYIFFVLPQVSDKSIQNNRTAKFWYFVKCIYFLFSAWQIRNGYPNQVIGNLLTKSYGIVSFILFSVFFNCPFLFEIRTLIDWIWTDTSLPLFDFFTMENFYAIAYKLKCGRRLETKYPAPRGQPKGAVVKYAMGGGMLFVIILIIFLPLLLYSLLNYIGQQSLPETVTFSVTLSGYPALYSMIAQRKYLSTFDKQQMLEMKDIFGGTGDKAKSSLEYLSDYSGDNRLIVEMRQESLVTWDISSPSFKALQSDLQMCGNSSGASMYMAVKIEFQRPRVDQKPAVKHGFENSFTVGSDLCNKLYDVLDPAKTEVTEIDVPEAYPPYLSLPPEGDASEPSQIYKAFSSMVKKQKNRFRSGYANMTLSMQKTEVSTTVIGRVWRVQGEEGSPTNSKCSVNPCGPGNTECCMLAPVDKSNKNGVQIVAFVDKLFPSWLSSVVKGGIIAMYVAVVLLVSGSIRKIVVGDPLAVIIKEMPYLDRMLKICLDIYLVRANKNFVLEQDLFAKLIFLFRSPETLIKWTRPGPKQKNE